MSEPAARGMRRRGTAWRGDEVYLPFSIVELYMICSRFMNIEQNYINLSKYVYDMV